jgi:hypothetical protein
MCEKILFILSKLVLLIMGRIGRNVPTSPEHSHIPGGHLHQSHQIPAQVITTFVSIPNFESTSVPSSICSREVWIASVTYFGTCLNHIKLPV